MEKLNFHPLLIQAKKVFRRAFFKNNLLNTGSATRRQKGVASLPAIILFGGLLVEIGIAGALLVFYLNSSLYGTRLANEALVIAQAGVDDAMLRIVRDKTCPNASCPEEYTITAGNGSADVTICKDSCAGIDKTEITSVGRVFTRRHKLITIVSIDATTGLITIDSVTDAEL